MCSRSSSRDNTDSKLQHLVNRAKPLSSDITRVYIEWCLRNVHVGVREGEAGVGDDGVARSPVLLVATPPASDGDIAQSLGVVLNPGLMLLNS